MQHFALELLTRDGLNVCDSGYIAIYTVWTSGVLSSHLNIPTCPPRAPQHDLTYYSGHLV